MAQINTRKKAAPVFTHEGGKAVTNLSAEQQLRRSVMSCLLWEKEFYESGQVIADRIVEAAEKVKPEVLAEIAIEAREVFHLRHVPLLLLTVLSKTGQGDHIVSDTVAQVIQRADEMGELLSIYWKNGRKMVPAGMRKGIARAFGKFNEYNLAKYDRDGAVKLRDVLRMVRPTPKNAEQSALWKRAKDRTLETPWTWETELSAGKDKKGTFEKLLHEGALGYLALLRNLRNMSQSGVDTDLVRDAILARKGASRVFPFRYVAAARIVPQFEPWLDRALLAAIGEIPEFFGETVLLVDVSQSMTWRSSEKSDLSRMDAAATLAAIFPGKCRVFTFSNDVVEVPPRKGMAGVDAVIKSQPHGGTRLFEAVEHINRHVKYDRIVVITDEQATGSGVRFGQYIQGSVSTMPAPLGRGYVINVASAQNGVGYGPWVHIDGFSEGVIRFIHETEMAECASIV